MNPTNSDAEQRRARLEGRHPTWSATTLAGALDRAVSDFADEPFVVTDAGQWTYRQVADWSRRIAGGLQRAGARPGDHVAVIMANFAEMVATKFAISRVGATAIPMSYLLRRHEIEYVLRQSDARFLITMDRFRDLDYLAALDAISPGWRTSGGGTSLPALEAVFVHAVGGGALDGAAQLEDLVAGATMESDPLGAPEDYSDILYTSGTTGEPKGVLLTHDMVLRTAYGSAYQRALGPGHRMIFAMPVYHVFGYIECLLAAMFVGGAIHPQVVFDPAATLDAIEAHRIDELVCIPTMTLSVMEEAVTRPRDLSSLTTVFSSGGVSPRSIWAQIRDVLQPVDITTGYGMTETTAATTCTEPGGPDERLWSTNGRLRDAGVAGDPANRRRLADYKAIDPATGADVPAGHIGELVVKGPGVTPGYYRKPEETAAAFTPDGWLHTGDLGSVDSDGFVLLTGRLKESYRCGGEMVMPAEVESVLSGHPDVRQAWLAGVPDPRMGEVGAAFIVAEPGRPVDPVALRSFCEDNLARFKVPRYYLPIEASELPLTATGRPQKFRLSQMALDRIGREVEVLVIGAGFAGLRALHTLRSEGRSVAVLEAGAGIGGVWYWNRYPGARCDVESYDYSYSFSEELEQDWRWSERYATQPEILRYIEHVADRFDLRRDVHLGQRMTRATFDEPSGKWTVETEQGTRWTARYLIMATGNLSTTKRPDLPGLGEFAGEILHSGRWPHEPVDFTGRRVGVIGTGSSGIQMAPEIARRAERLTVFQRTPAYSVPARNGPISDEQDRRVKLEYRRRREIAQNSPTGLTITPHKISALADDPDRRLERLEEAWNGWGFGFVLVYPDILLDEDANRIAADFIRDKIAATVSDPDVRARLTPHDYHFGTKRPPVDSGYYETFNRTNVDLVDVRANPIVRADRDGLVARDGTRYPLDVIVFATGFDALTGSLLAPEIIGRGGTPLRRAWAGGPQTYLGLMASRFPNLFVIAGPGSPALLANVMLTIELHIDWIRDLLRHADAEATAPIVEADGGAEREWVAHVNERAAQTLYPKTASYYMGSEMPGKPRVFMPYAGGYRAYRRILEEVRDDGFRGFVIGDARATADRSLQPQPSNEREAV